MKNKKKILVFIILLMCLLTSVLLVNKFVKKQKVEEIKDIDFTAIIGDVNLSTNSNFVNVFENDIVKKEYFETDADFDEFGHQEKIKDEVFITVDESTNYIIAVGLELDEYFIIIENPTNEQIKQFNNVIKEQGKNTKYGKNSKYIYLIKSKEFSSTIEGIIRSYIY